MRHRIAVDIAEILHPILDLAERVGRLVVRLDLGIEAAAVEIGRLARGQLSRSDYRKLVAVGLTSASQLKAADEATLVECFDDDRLKLKIVHEVADKMAEQERRRAGWQQLQWSTSPASYWQKPAPVLEPYVA